MRKSNLSFILAALLLTFCLMTMTGGCGSSSSHSSSNRDKFIDLVGDIADDLEAIAKSAVTNRKVVNAIEDVVGQYIVLNSADSTLRDKAFFKSLTDGFVRSEDISAASGFKVGLFCEAFSNKHIEVSHDVAEVTANHTTDFQLTVTSSDNHVTRLTVTPTSSTTYWQALSQASAFLNSLYVGAESQYEVLFFIKVYESANIKVEYKDASETSYTTLLDGTIDLSYPNKSNGDYVYENTPHTTKLNFTLYPQDSKDYTVGIDLTRSATSNGTSTLDTKSELNMYRKSSSGSTSTLLSLKAAAAVTMPANPTANVQPTAVSITELDINIADKIRLAASDAIDIVKLMGFYVTGTSATEAQIEANAEKINDLFADAGLSLYLNNRTVKAGDIKALAGTIGSFKHVRFGIQFNNSDEVELVRDVVNPEDLQKIRSLIGSVSGQIQALSQLFESSGLVGELSDNKIFQLILGDLLGAD
ncbi:MAG: hypothetical protein IJ576_07825 [Synergistaceae bacterium]|nr:hypothetical protein [Synergistaceae bacterium]MBR1603869.1 hypothetical protein [Synergistaceae bacterium]